ncbi:hypothetical protein SO802_023418 [Lithocarpus litseifolius]|uniref:Uncharacterized protein n=1 Tax=Lithocarpus litseifolius TaxID=425828 RepID=A0AAW2C9M3_9ROSI
MAGDLRTWDDDCVDELCDIVFGEFWLGNFAQGVPRDLVWDVITQTLNTRTRKDFRRRQVVNQFHLQRWYCRVREVLRYARSGHRYQCSAYHVKYLNSMAHESQDADDKLWPSHVEHIFIEIMLEEQIKGNMENGLFKGPMWQGDRSAVNLQKKGCLNYDKLKQLFAPSTATGHLQISSYTPTLTSDEECALEEELANDVAATHLDDDCYTPNLESIPQTVEETEVDGQTQAVVKRPMQDASAKGKKVSKKADRVSEMIVAQ